MSGYEAQADANPLSAFALMIGGALGVALPMTIVIIWIVPDSAPTLGCSMLLFALAGPTYSADV